MSHVILSIHIMPHVSYGITGYDVSRPGIQNKKDFCMKINISKGNDWFLRIGLMGSLGSLKKSELLKLIILIFHEKIEKLVWIRCKGNCLQLLGFWNFSNFFHFFILKLVEKIYMGVISTHFVPLNLILAPKIM